VDALRQVELLQETGRQASKFQLDFGQTWVPDNSWMNKE
jgi:hypothetical protein